LAREPLAEARIMIESLLLAVTRVTTMLGQQHLTKAAES
jgi:hypothetical protein